MLTSTFLPLTTIISLASARALFTANAYLLPSLTTSTTTNSTTTFSFVVYDADPVTNISTTCSSSWSPITAYPSTWIPCQNTAFDWELSAFTSSSEFELQVKHSFVDASLGPPPQNVATTFAKATFTAENLTCSDSSCELKSGNGTVKLPIWAASG